MIIYETPNKLYRVYKQDDLEWESIFGKTDLFNLAKYDSSLAEYNKRNPESNLSDYFIITSFETFDGAMNFLYQVSRAISKDEMNAEIKKFNEKLVSENP